MPVAVNRIVLWVGRLDRRGEAENIVAEPEIRRRYVAEERIAVFDRKPVQRSQILFRRMPVTRVVERHRPIAGPLSAPIERPYNAIVCSKTKPVFPLFHPAAIQTSHACCA